MNEENEKPVLINGKWHINGVEVPTLEQLTRKNIISKNIAMHWLATGHKIDFPIDPNCKECTEEYWEEWLNNEDNKLHD